MPGKKRFGLVIASSLGMLVFIIAGVFILTKPTEANDTGGFNPENIISDGVFTNYNSMSIGQIQSFLQNNGSTCLANFQTQSLNDLNGDGLGDEPYGKGWGEQVSAATVIWQAAQLYRINPQVILVTLQKEQGLITRGDCPSWRYNTALGYGCPDSEPCDNSAYGFTRQIDYGVWHFRGFFDDTFPVPPTVPGEKYIAYNPVGSCGGKVLNIRNRATAALYSYTPYQPNAATLAAAQGQLVDCGAYGNLNFWRYFNRWFDPYGALANNLRMDIVSQPDATPARGQDVSYTVSFTNNLPYAVTVDAIGVVGRLNNHLSGEGRDFGWQGPITLQPGVAQQFTFTTTIRDVGTIYAWPSVAYQGRYIHYNNWGTVMNSHQANLTLTTPLSMSPSNPTTGETVTLSAAVKNNEEHPIRMNTVGIPIRYFGRYNYDVGWVSTSGGTIASGETKNLSGSTTFDKSGPYDAWVSWNMNGLFTTLSPTLSKNVGTPRPDFTLTYLETPNTGPALGEDIAVKFKLKNNLSVPLTLNAVGVVGRYGNPYSGPNKDLGWVGPVTFAAGEEKSYTTFVDTISKLETLYTWVAVNHNGAYTHYNNWGFMISPHAPNLSLSTPLTINSGNPVQAGQTVSATATIKNNEPKPIRYSALGIPARYYGTYNYDATWVGPGTLAAAGQSGDTVALSGMIPFDKTGPYTIWSAANIGGIYITIGNQKNMNL